jgi:hypothetical protein
MALNHSPPPPAYTPGSGERGNDTGNMASRVSRPHLSR